MRIPAIPPHTASVHTIPSPAAPCRIVIVALSLVTAAYVANMDSSSHWDSCRFDDLPPVFCTSSSEDFFAAVDEDTVFAEAGRDDPGVPILSAPKIDGFRGRGTSDFEFSLAVALFGAIEADIRFDFTEVEVREVLESAVDCFRYAIGGDDDETFSAAVVSGLRFVDDDIPAFLSESDRDTDPLLAPTKDMDVLEDCCGIAPDEEVLGGGLFPDTSKERIADILCLSDTDPVLHGLDIETAVEIILASLEEDDEFSDDEDGEQLEPGVDHDIDTLIKMFPSLAIDSAKELLKSRGGLHSTIDFLTRSHSPTNDPFPPKERGKTYLTNTSYNKISHEYEKEQGWDTVPTKMRFSNASNVNPHIPQTDDTQILEPHHIATTQIQEDDMDISKLNAEYCRQQAQEYATKRGKAFQDAAREFKKGTLTGRGSAQYYSDIGHQHSIQVSLWNSRAAKCVLRANSTRHNHNPSIIDLHGLTKAEAVCALTNKLDEYFKRRTGSAVVVQKPLQVITGLGIHSGNFKPVLLPVVLAMLKRDGWRFEQYDTNEGFIEVKG
ncbi:UNVERIFIED_CONTAM: hypothetical protein HDU68_000525, partial [Siphonaria sp. JEL0065]